MSVTVNAGARGTAAWRWLASAILLGTLFTLVDTTALWRELQRIPLWVVLPAVVLSVVQVVISSWRWCYTGKRLGLNMALGDAVQEYYLATFINQVLPGGVLGDVNRAVRHGAKAGKRQKAAHAVAIERLSGQLVLALAVGLGLVLLWQANVFKPLLVGSSATGWFPLVLLLVIAGGFLLLRRYSIGFKEYLLALNDDVRQALFSWPALPLQLVSSLLVIISYLAVFLLLAVAADYVNSAAAAAVLLALCTVLLLSMVIPLTVAGWGIREGAAALLWPLAGLPAEQGVALSVGYGALVFMGSCPGALVLLKGRRGLR